MIKSVALKNFRGFRDHTIDFTPFCLLIGQNNAGKTTIIESLRVASTALSKARTARYMMAPDDLGPDFTGPCFRFSIDTLDLEERGIHYNYETSDPALIRVRYNNNCSVLVAFGETVNDIYCQLLLPGGKKANSRSSYSAQRFRDIFVMPPVGALLPEETQRDKQYLYKHINGYLSYRHIRNQMSDMPEEFSRFRSFLTETWSSNLKVGDIEYGLGEKRNHYGLTIRDGPFVSEMALVGSGLQAWIQTIWFLARVDTDSIVILDEPDVYLHADLQRKLIKLLSAERYRQTIVATHSMEMIADVSPTEIISVLKRDTRSRPLSSSAQAQSVVDAIGTNLNIQLSKLADSGAIIFVEGKDYPYLDQIAFKLGNTFYDRFAKIPHFPIGGMNNWPRAAMAAKAFFETSSGKVQGFIFLDRDYKPDALFDEISQEASKDHLTVHTWSCKEIENFFLEPALIHSYIENRAKISVNLDDVMQMIQETVDEMVVDLPELIGHAIQSLNKGLALPTAMKEARSFMAERYNKGFSDSALICGKKAISTISGKSQIKWGVQISPMSLCRHMKQEHVPLELLDAVRRLA